MTGITTTVRGPSAVWPKVAVGDAASNKRNSLLAALVLLAAVQLMVVLDTTIVNVALPSIQRGLGFSIGGIAWVVNGYALTFGALLLLGGRSGDLLGRRNVFIGSLAVFALASTLGGLASGPAMLVAGRVLQGAAAAFAQATALSLIVSTFPAGAARNRAVGVFAAMEGLGAAAGLLLGGVLVNSLGWRWVFFVNVPVAVVVAALAPRFIPVAARRSARFDLRGAASATVGLGLLVFGLSRAAEHGWADITTFGPIAVGVLGLLVFVRIEARSAQPLMPLWVFADRNRGGAYLIQALMGAALFGMFFLSTLYLQNVLGYGPLKAGVAFVPVAVALIAAAGAVSQIVTRIGVRPLVAAGTATAALGMFLLGNLNADSTYLSGVLPPLIILSRLRRQREALRARLGRLDHRDPDRRRDRTRRPRDHRRHHHQKPGRRNRNHGRPERRLHEGIPGGRRDHRPRSSDRSRPAAPASNHGHAAR